jgi:hypothetical protein
MFTGVSSLLNLMLKLYVALLLAVVIVVARSEHADPEWFYLTEPRVDLSRDGHTRALRTDVASTGAPHCGPLTRELVQGVARENSVLVTVIDKIVWKCFGPSYVENIQAANISYWLIAALDPETSVALGAMGIRQCFNAPQDRLRYKGSGGLGGEPTCMVH